MGQSLVKAFTSGQANMRRFNFAPLWPLTGTEVREILSFSFRTGVASYFSFLLIEYLRPGFVTLFFNLNIFLWAAIVTGLLSTRWPMAAPVAMKHRHPGWKDFVWITLLSLGTAAVVWYKTSTIGWQVNIIAPFSGLVVLGLSLFAYYDRHDKPDSSS